MAKKDNNKIIWIVIVAGALLIYGASQGWFSSNNNSSGSGSSNNQDYYCCNSANGYYCSLNSCGLGQTKVYSGSFDTLNNCNAKCVTPTLIQTQPTQNQPVQTCQQIANGLGALYKNTPVATAKECMDFAVLDCQDTGKILDGYGVQGTCCYYTCVQPAIPDPVVCSVSNSNLLTIEQRLQSQGTCTDSNGPLTDTCDNGMLKEYYCEPGMNGGAAMCGYVSYNCGAMIPGTICSNGHCINLV